MAMEGNMLRRQFCSINLQNVKLNAAILHIIRFIIAVTALTIFFVFIMMSFREFMYDHFDPYWIDYNAPGVDITSEGP